MTLQKIKDEFSKYIFLSDYNCLDVSLGASIANRLRGPSLNVYLIGPPSTAKTEVVRIMANHPSNFFLTEVTEHTFFSGALGNYSLVPAKHTAGVRTILMQDFTILLENPSNVRQQIISQMRGIADGFYHRIFGQAINSKKGGPPKRVEIHWEGTMGFIVPTTSAIEDYHQVSNIMGDRFLNYRMPEADDDKSTEYAQNALLNGDEWRLPIQQMVSEFLDQFDNADSIEVGLPKDMARSIRDMGVFVAHARMGVPRDRYHKHITRIPEREGAARLVKLLTKLVQGLLLVQHKTDADDELYKIIIDLVWSNMPRNRAIILKYLWNREPVTVETLAERLRMPSSSTRVFLENLKMCDLVSSNGEKWELSGLCSKLIKNTGILK